MLKDLDLTGKPFIAAASIVLIALSVFFTVSCGGLSEATIEFYKQIEPIIEETNASLDQASQLMSAASIEDTQEIISFGAQAADQFVNPGVEGDGQEMSPDELTSMTTQFDSLTAQLSADLSAPVAPEECAACGELVTKLEDSRKRAVEELKQGDEVITAVIAVATVRNTELEEVKAIPFPQVSLDLAAATTPWESALASYEKALAAYQAIEQSDDLKENLDALIATQQELIAATREEISAMRSFDDNLMMQTQNDAIQVASKEVLYFNGLMQHARESILELDGNLMSLAREVDDLRDEIPDDLDS